MCCGNLMGGSLGETDARIYVTECIAVHLNYHNIVSWLYSSKHVSSKLKKLSSDQEKKKTWKDTAQVKLQRVTTGKFPLLMARERCKEVMISDNGYGFTNGFFSICPQCQGATIIFFNYTKFNALIKSPCLFLCSFREQIFYLGKGYYIIETPWLALLSNRFSIELGWVSKGNSWQF